MSEIMGYKTLSEVEINRINVLKDLGNQIGNRIKELENHPTTDKRWVAIAKTDLQRGIMAAVRAIAQPDSF